MGKVLEAVFRATLAADTELRPPAQAVHRLAGAAHEVGMYVRVEDVGDREAETARRLEIDLHVGGGSTTAAVPVASSPRR